MMNKILVVVIVMALIASSTMAFSPSAFTGSRLTSIQKSTTISHKSSQMKMFFGQKDDGSPGDYVCLDCGYVFTQGPEAWAKLPSNWSCPPCGSIKRRFKKVPKGSASGKVEVAKKK
jgi:rubredoxin